jgi:hypothetical protein
MIAIQLFITAIVMMFLGGVVLVAVREHDPPLALKTVVVGLVVGSFVLAVTSILYGVWTL